MSKIYAQSLPVAWQSSASMAVSGSQTSGSFPINGYARLVGILISNASAKAGSGLRIYQSVDNGANWDWWSDFVPSACSGSAFSIEVIGNAAKIECRTDGAASLFRTLWQLRPV